MPELKLKRVLFTNDADVRLRMLKARTGITPNLLCRLGFCLSLDEPGLPPPPNHNDKAGREINRYTLLGEYDAAFVHLLVARMQKDELPEEKTDEMFLAHIERGVNLLAARLRVLGDLGPLVPRTKDAGPRTPRRKKTRVRS